MARRTAGQPVRQQMRTALMVGEGLSEDVFLQHLKHLYARRGDVRITIKNAKGKGGMHVLDYALRQCKVADYDRRLVLLDTDTDWGDPQRADARKGRIEVVEAQPCLEALLLRIAGAKPAATSAGYKDAFKRRFGAQAHAVGVYERHFPQTKLDEARSRVPALDQLIRFVQHEGPPPPAP